jgi:hypothetical protein
MCCDGRVALGALCCVQLNKRFWPAEIVDAARSIAGLPAATASDSEAGALAALNRSFSTASIGPITPGSSKHGSAAGKHGSAADPELLALVQAASNAAAAGANPTALSLASATAAASPAPAAAPAPAPAPAAADAEEAAPPPPPAGADDVPPPPPPSS